MYNDWLGTNKQEYRTIEKKVTKDKNEELKKQSGFSNNIQKRHKIQNLEY